MSSDRVLPHNLEAERAILGAVLVDGARLIDAQEFVKPQQFYRIAHRQVFEAMAWLSDRGTAIDTLTVKDELKRRGLLEEVGGPAFVASLTDGVPRGTNVGHYAQIVREKASLRELIDGANRMLRRAYEAEEGASAILEKAEQDILGLADSSVTAGFQDMKTVAARGLDYLEEVCRTRQAVTGVPSGFVDLDNLTRGFHPGRLIVLAARPGMGKTSIAINMAQHAASTGRVVGVFSLEMDCDELFIRQLAAEARLDSHRLQSGYVNPSEWDRISRAIGTIAESPIYIDPTPSISVYEIRSRCRRLKVEKGLDFVVIDYLQLMDEESYSDSRALNLGVITRSLKGLSKELKVPILVLSQLSRKTDDRTDHRPRLSDLRESGAIEQDADIVMFLFREEEYTPTDQNRGLAELILGKHRGGPVGTIKLTWRAEETRFENFEMPAPAERQLPMGDRW